MFIYGCLLVCAHGGVGVGALMCLSVLVWMFIGVFVDVCWFMFVCCCVAVYVVVR